MTDSTKNNDADNNAAENTAADNTAADTSAETTTSEATASSAAVEAVETKPAKKVHEAPNFVAHSRQSAVSLIAKAAVKKNIPNFKPGDTVKVHAKIIEGNKERVQIFEGVVLKRHKKNGANATFTVRKVSYNVGVERTFFLFSPRIEKIEVVTRGIVRRSRLFYLRPLRGKAARIKSLYMPNAGNTEQADVSEVEPDGEKTNGNDSVKKSKSAEVEAQAQA